MTSADEHAWSFETARVPTEFAAAVHPQAPDTEHAVGRGQTLCGIADELVTVYRHLFRPERPAACATCRAAAAAAPTRPSGQERLHNLLGAAAPGQARDELTNALRQGARIRLWMEGPARKLAKDYIRLAAINEGRDAVSDLLHTDGRIGLAKVEHEDQQFVVILPGDGPPVIVRAEPGS